MPEVSLKDLSDRATPGEAYADMGDYRLIAHPTGSTYIPDRTVVALCACGDKAGANAHFLAALWTTYRRGELHDDTALATAVARARREALEEADNREVERILGLSDAEVSAEIEAEGRDPGALAEAMRGQMNATFRLCEEIKRLREALAPFAAILANGEPVGPIPRGLLDSKITRQDLRRATAALAATPPEARQTETGWKPMETAHKDGRTILACRYNGCGWDFHLVRWQSGKHGYPWQSATDDNAFPEGRLDYWQPVDAPPPAIGNLEGEVRS